ncbi:MAG: alanine racemase [Dethiosulfatibacter sp.]|nr:alanine racemase [Dethiosulfatibacter sp.]
MVDKNYNLYRDTYFEIDLDHLSYNISEVQKFISDQTKIAAVVKANAYGFGSVDIAPTLIDGGVEYLAVANLGEAIELRNHYSNYPILIMGHTPDRYLKEVIENNLCQTIFTLDQAISLSELGYKYARKANIQIKYDTGFNRLGFKANQNSKDEILHILNLENINVKGIFSHLALTSYADDLLQLNKFKDLIDFIQKNNYNIDCYHICDSISGIDYKDFRLDMIRLGAAMFGLKSYKNEDITLKNVGTLKTRISSIKTIDKSEGVGYDYTWKAKRDSVIATLPFGYADGYPRNMRDKGEVTIKGVRVPIIGVICMDQCIVDITDLTNIEVGTEVVIFGDGNNNSVTIQELAEKSQTNKNDIVTRISRRVPRVYLKNKNISHVSNYLL